MNICVTFHLLLHLMDSLRNCGPAWVFWEFPCERVCGMLKPKVKNQSQANRNLSLGILYEEQLKHLQFVRAFRDPPGKQRICTYTALIQNQEYSFLRPRQFHCKLSSTETTNLVSYYANLFNCTSRAIIKDDISNEIIKWSSCLLANNVDAVSSEWGESRRKMVISSRESSVVRCSMKRDNNELLTVYGRMLYFFLHEFRECT